jgi:predicted DCC family thiol-disulfide oxidoreductase YuxK
VNSPAPTPAPLGWILYDDACGVCRRWVPFWEGALRRRGFAVAPLQSEWVQGRLRLDPDELLRDLRLLFLDGSHLAGAEVYRYAMRRIWWAWPAYALSVLPGFRRLFDWGYRTFATHRLRVSAVCGLRGGMKVQRAIGGGDTQ